MSNVDTYLAYLSGDYTGELPQPRPIRVEMYLACMCGLIDKAELPAPREIFTEKYLYNMAVNGSGGSIPELLNPAVAEDIRLNKQAINAEKEVITGTYDIEGVESTLAEVQALNEELEARLSGDGTVGQDWEITDASYLFYNGAREDVIPNLLAKCKKLTNCYNMFSACRHVTDIDLSKVDTSSVTNMASMFSMCQRLESLNLTGVKTPMVQNMEQMFKNCESLKSIDVSGFETPSVTTMDGMFSYCYLLDNIDISNFDMSAVTNLSMMFANCTSLKSVTFGKKNTSLVKNFSSMFSACRLLESVDVENLDTSASTSMSQMFYDCQSIQNLDVSGFNTEKVVGMGSMFSGCRALIALDLSGWDTGKVTSMSSMFQDCYALEEIIGFSAMNKAGINIAFPSANSDIYRKALKRLTFRTDLPDGQYAIRSAIYIPYCSMERSGFVEMANTLTDVSGMGLTSNYTTITITGNPCVTGLLPDGTACDTITDEDRAIATGKGWTLVE